MILLFAAICIAMIVIVVCFGLVHIKAVDYRNKEMSRWVEQSYRGFRNSIDRHRDAISLYRSIANRLCDHDECDYCPYDTRYCQEKCMLGKLNDKVVRWNISDCNEDELARRLGL